MCPLPGDLRRPQPAYLGIAGLSGGRERGKLENIAGAPRNVRGMSAQQPSRAGAIASNTGCTSEGELAMTLRISAVAVCRSSASFVR
jgi:hypothetical protein